MEDPFSFFAVELKVVRIGNSPMVPMFDVVERPNDWERSIQTKAKEQRASSDITKFRLAFWTNYVSRHPSEGQPEAVSNRWRVIPSLDLVLSSYVTRDRVGLFVRGLRGVPAATTVERLSPYAEQLEKALGAPFNQEGDNFYFLKRVMIDDTSEANWNRAADWIKTEADRYEQALKDILGGKA